ncbi:MAG: LysR family transcriptional regulator [Herminiimonas sp.]|nr:LysR family transcriptional regulator [Herminiimonas sp.]
MVFHTPPADLGEGCNLAYEPYEIPHLYASLKQWRMLHAVVDCGGFAQAAERIHVSQSTLSHSINKLQEQLGVQLTRLAGRRSVLTPIGWQLLERSRRLLQEAHELEKLARSARDFEAEAATRYRSTDGVGRSSPEVTRYAPPESGAHGDEGSRQRTICGYVGHADNGSTTGT